MRSSAFKAMVLLCILSVHSVVLFSQTFEFTFKALPLDSVNVYVNNSFKGYAPQTVRLNFNAKKEINSHTVKFTKRNYEDKIITVTIPEKNYKTIEERLERAPVKLVATNKDPIAFNKVISGISRGTQVGVTGAMKEPIIWEYGLGDELPDDFSQVIEKALIKNGFTVLEAEKKDIFYDAGKDESWKAPLLLGAKIVHMRVEMKGGNIISLGYSLMTTSIKLECTVKIEWQLYDKLNKKVLYKTTNDGYSPSMPQSWAQALYDALEDACFKLVRTDTAFVMKILNPGIETKKTGGKIFFLEKIPAKNYSSPSEMIKEAMKSSVTVKIDNSAHGSGAIVSGDGYVVTNLHVIKESKTIEVMLPSGFSLPAAVISTDEDYDLALLKINGSGFPALPIGNSDKAEVGDEVIAIGSPIERELSQSVSKGIISSKRVQEGKEILQTDIKISMGNSGSPLINQKGEIVGIINSGYFGFGAGGVSFAIPSNFIFLNLGVEYK